VSLRRRQVGKAARNERRKFIATALNAAGLATLGFGTLAPALGTVPTGPGLQSLACAVIWFIVLAIGYGVLGDLED
jgi:hypothetical protein